jgi:exosortase
MLDFNTPRKNRWLLFSSWIVLSLALFLSPILALVKLSLSQDDASYPVIIPFISTAVLYLERDKIFQQASIDKMLGGTFLLLAGLAVLISSHLAKSNPLLGLQLSGWILALVLFWVSGFAFLFGKAALRAAHFPFLFLLLMIPIPTFVLDRIIFLLQEGSAWITGAFFDIFHIPALREGFIFHLARINIEVAKECSGIRSSMALLILALLVAHFRLKHFWNKALFVASGLFMMILKNGIRIATLTMLAVYVDPSFLSGRLHHEGGIIFFVLALLLLLPVLALLQHWESGMVAEPPKTS